jgi:hypothetical protein
MNSILATEATKSSLLETWEGNERMRHIPSIDWMVRKVDIEVRSRIEKSMTPILGIPSEDPRRQSAEEELRVVCRALERLAEIARHGHPNGRQGDLPHRVEAALDLATENLRSLDADLIGRRFPFQTFERSKAEPLFAALLVVLNVVNRIIPLARAIEPDLDERLLEGLVVLENPVDDRMLEPMA